MKRRKAGPAAGTFRTGLEITNRSGWLTRSYRLLLLPDCVRIAYADGRTTYDVRHDEECGGVTCTCPAFAADGDCKHRDTILALMDGLMRRLDRGSAAHAHARYGSGSGREIER
jgi:hypothetical protein